MPTPKLHFTRDEFSQRIAKTRTAMRERGLDLLIVTDPSNMNWLTGYDGWSFYVHQCVVLTLEGEPIWYGRGQDANGALRTCFMDPANIIGYPDHYVQSTERHPMDYLSAQLTDRKLDRGTIGVEMDNYWFSAAALASLQQHLPNAHFRQCQRAGELAAGGQIRDRTGLHAHRRPDRGTDASNASSRRSSRASANAIWSQRFMTLRCAMTPRSAAVAIIRASSRCCPRARMPPRPT